MQIRSAQLVPYKLPLRKTWHSSKQSIDSRQGYLLYLQTSNGLDAFGDCAPLPVAGTESFETALSCLQHQLKLLPSLQVDEARQQLSAFNHCPAARFALETALLNLQSTEQKKSLRHFLSDKSADSIQVNCMLGSLNNETADLINQAVGQGFDVIKIKVGTHELDKEIELLERICAGLPESVSLRLDANQAWTEKEAVKFILAIESMPVESLEEPLKTMDLNKMVELQQQTTISLALDESLSSISHEKLLNKSGIRRLIIKPMALGGLLPALNLARKAQKKNMEIVVSSIIESSIGLTATAQLAAAINNEADSLTHGLATAPWLMNNVASTPVIKQGKMYLSDSFGLGVSPLSGFIHEQL